MSESDRRSVVRKVTCYPVHFELNSRGETASTGRIALVYDLSIAGALLYTRKKLALGEVIRMHLDGFEPAPPMATVDAKVVRCTRRPPERSDIWTFEVGVQFDAPVAELEATISELARRAPTAGR
jgi:hypothetical protein